LLNWTKKQLAGNSASAQTLISLKNAVEVKEFVKDHFGQTENALKFANEFIKRRNFQQNNTSQTSQHTPANETKQDLSTKKEEEKCPTRSITSGFHNSTPSSC